MTVVMDRKPILKGLKKNKRENPSSSPWLDIDSNLNPSYFLLFRLKGEFQISIHFIVKCGFETLEMEKKVLGKSEARQ